jgi:hypothetical protein
MITDGRKRHAEMDPVVNPPPTPTRQKGRSPRRKAFSAETHEIVEKIWRAACNDPPFPNALPVKNPILVTSKLASVVLPEPLTTDDVHQIVTNIKRRQKRRVQLKSK